jgi:hypothetical protein
MTDLVPDEQWGEEDKMWSDAWRIAWVGASNPAGVARALGKHAGALAHKIGTREAENHLALRAIAGHLAFLFGHGLGPSDEELNAVQANGERLGLHVHY